jgi:hypothetical protein
MRHLAVRHGRVRGHPQDVAQGIQLETVKIAVQVRLEQRGNLVGPLTPPAAPALVSTAAPLCPYPPLAPAP